MTTGAITRMPSTIRRTATGCHWMGKKNTTPDVAAATRGEREDRQGGCPRRQAAHRRRLAGDVRLGCGSGPVGPVDRGVERTAVAWSDWSPVTVDYSVA